MSMNVGVAYQIRADVAGGNQVGGLRKEVSLLKNETAALPKNFKTAASSAREFAAVLGIGFGAQQIMQFGKATLEVAGHITDLSQRTGFSTTAIQKLGYAAKLTGADIDAVAQSAVKMNVRIGNALAGNNSAIQAFQQLRLDPGQLANMNTDERFNAIATAISKVGDASLKAKLGSDIFGRGFATLLPIMSQGKDSAAALGDELERIGGVISPEDVALLDEFDDSLASLGITAKTQAAGALSFLIRNQELLIDAGTAVAFVYGTRVTAALALATRAYIVNTLATQANTRAMLLAEYQTTGNVRAIVSMYSATTRLRTGLTSLVNFMGGPLNVALMAAAAGWFYVGTQLDENITRVAAFRATLITLRGELEKGAYLSKSSGFLGIGRASYQEQQSGVKAIQDRIDNELLALRTPTGETASAKSRAEMQKEAEEFKKNMAATLAEIEKAQDAADARSKSKSDAASSAERAIKVRERELRQLDDFILKQKQANEELAQQNSTIGLTSIELEKLEAARKLDDEAARATIRMQPDIKAKYLETTEAIKKQRLELLQKNYDERRTFATGSKQALSEYLESIGDAAASAKTFWTNSFTAMEDALVEFTRTGKLNFRSLASSIIDDIIRIQVRSTISGPLSSLLGSLNPFGGGNQNAGYSAGEITSTSNFANGGVMTSRGPLPLRRYAAGGIADSPQVALFGEGKYKEAYVPLPDGRSIPVTMKGQNGDIGITIINNINSDGSSTTETRGTSQSEQAAVLSRQMAAVAKSVIVKEKMPGGILS